MGQLFQQQTGHHDLVGTWIIGKQKSNAGQVQEIAKHCFRLMRQWFNASNGQANVGFFFNRQYSVATHSPENMDLQEV